MVRRVVGEQAAGSELVLVDGVQNLVGDGRPGGTAAEQLNQVRVDVGGYPVRVARIADEHEMQVVLGNAVLGEHLLCR